MTTTWDALAARARGLATHLLDDDRARAVEHAATVGDVWLSLRETPYARHLVGIREGGAEAIELAVTRSLAERMALLARWAGPGGGALRAVFLGQDARNVRDILRGHVGGVPADRRAARAIPTPLLARKELEALARAESPAGAAAALVAWGHPFGSALLEETRRGHPDLYRLEAALARRAAQECVRAARRGGVRVKAFVREAIDAGNAVTALVLAGERSESDAADLFVEGGEALQLDDFLLAAAAPTRESAAAQLAGATRGSAVSTALRDPPATAAALSTRILAARIGRLARQNRQEPVSAVPVLLFVLRLGREAELLRRALWRAALTGGGRP